MQSVCDGLTGVDHPPPPWNVDDVTRAMSKGGGACERRVNVELKSGGAFQFFGGRMTSRGQCPRREGGTCECLHPPTPSGNPVSAPEYGSLDCSLYIIAEH